MSNPPPSAPLGGHFSHSALLRMRAASAASAATNSNVATNSTNTASTAGAAAASTAVNTAATASTSRAPVAKVADKRKAMVDVVKPTESIPRKTREQLNTGNAVPERRERLPITYDALETVAPLDPEVQEIETEFKYDSFIKGRKAPAVYLHGDRMKETFDAENFDVLDDKLPRNNAYKSKLRAERLGLDKGKMPEVEQELDIAAKHAQPTKEQFEQWKRDVNNPEYIKSIKKNAIRSSNNLDEIRRARQLNDPEVQKRRRDEIQRAFINNSKERNENPDFYTGFSDYNLAAAKKAADKQRKGGDDDDDDDDDKSGSTSSKNTAEKKKTSKATAETKNKLSSREEENAPVPISVEDARQLLHYNPLTRLQAVMHKDFLMLPEISQSMEFLNALQQKPETYHRKHYNAVEFVRAMDLCGAKYDGSILLSTTAPLRDLLDKNYYSSAYTLAGDFIDTHEHFEKKKTILAVFKFYCVLRNKENVDALSKYALDDDGHANIMNTDLFDPTALLGESRKYTRLDKPGLYDVDNVVDADDDDGTNPDGSMHSIKKLAEKFMFCLRVVCVVPAPLSTVPLRHDKEDDSVDSEISEYASLEDGDFVLPEYPPATLDATPAAAGGGGDANAMGEDPTECFTVGPEDEFTMGSHRDNDDDDGSADRSRRTRRDLVDNLQPSEFDDDLDDNAAPALSSEPREVLVSDTTTGRTRSSAARREKSSASNSELFGGDAGSKSGDENDDDDEFNFQNKRRAMMQQQQFKSLYYNTERFGVRQQDVGDDGLLSQDDEMLDRRFDERHPVQNPFPKKPVAVVAPVTGKYDVHTDDEKADGGDHDDDDSSLDKYLPDKQLTIDRTQAERLVGTWKAPDFEKKINRQYLTKVCVRAFAYYAVSLPITASAVGNKKKNRINKNKK